MTWDLHHEPFRYEPSESAGWYAAGEEWAKDKDRTVIVVFRTDDPSRRCVYLRRVNRKPWPEMIAMFNDVLGRYQAVSAHDGTGIGNVVNDLIDERAHKFVMTGRARTQLLVEYITAVERGVYRLPANTPAFAAHKGTTVEEVDAPGRWNSQLSDDVAAFALAHNAADRQAPPAAGEGAPRTEYVSRSQRELTYGPGEPALLAVGEVRMVEEETNPFVIS